MCSSVPYLTLNSGTEMPQIGLGTWQAEHGEIRDSVLAAIDAGYRHIDCAFIYGNEEAVGEAFKQAFQTIPRKEIFLTTKLWNTFHRPELVKPHLQESLRRLGVDYVDMYLIHWPTAYLPGDDLFPKKNGEFVADDKVTLEDTWKAFEELQTSGLTKAIGVCNFNLCQLKRILNCAKIMPANLQVELHPYGQHQELIRFAQSKGIVVTAYSPLGSPGTNTQLPPVINDPVIQLLAKKYNKTPGQILLRFEIDKRIVVIPKSVHADRIRENFNIFDFQLKDQDMKALNDLDKGIHYIVPKEAMNHKEFPFQEKLYCEEKKPVEWKQH